ncbi:MAG: hypothetical protein CBC35_00125 [Planctomycetes bacterium TMED75]|nr:MBL fold metallo-hydrolase [Planctomycetaceae bacterium]OUU96937.1 MAG: hypothetical protein CBC35_00125 [Planctomycetes bacterium TMED75]
MLLRQIYDEDLAHAAWLIGCQKTGDAIIIDPARDVDVYQSVAAAHSLKITAVAETHIHADFLSGARQLASVESAHVYVSGEGGEDWNARWLEGIPHTELNHGDEVHVGGIKLTALHTPGHTPEHLSYLITDLGGGADEPIGILSGDFVFVGDLGRPDLLETAAGIEGMKELSARDLARSARRFLELPDFLQVLPAHGAGSACGKALGAIPQSTVGYERRFNPALNLVGEEERFVAEMLSGQPSPPLYFARMKVQNRDGVPLLSALPQPTSESPETLGEGGRVVLDLRPWDAFREGHLPGALWTKTGPMFSASIGSLVQPDQSIALICAEEDSERLTRALVRIGLDRVEALCTTEAFESYRRMGGQAQCATSEQIPASDMADLIRNGHQVLDVRRPDEFLEGHVVGAINIPYTRLEAPEAQIPPSDQPLLVHCLGGIRSAVACSGLERKGIRVINVQEGWRGMDGVGLDLASGTEKTTSP